MGWAEVARAVARAVKDPGDGSAAGNLCRALDLLTPVADAISSLKGWFWGLVTNYALGKAGLCRPTNVQRGVPLESSSSAQLMGFAGRSQHFLASKYACHSRLYFLMGHFFNHSQQLKALKRMCVEGSSMLGHAHRISLQEHHVSGKTQGAL